MGTLLELRLLVRHWDAHSPLLGSMLLGWKWVTELGYPLDWKLEWLWENQLGSWWGFL